MSATQQRPPAPNPFADLTSEDLAWLTWDGIWLGLPPGMPEGQVAKAFAALEWIARVKRGDD